MAPEHKEILEIMLHLLGPAGLGGVAMAWIGWVRARREGQKSLPVPAPAPALEDFTQTRTPGHLNAMQLGGLVLSHQTVESLILAINKLADTHSDKTDLCRTINTQRLEEGHKNRLHEREILTVFGELMRDLTNSLRALKN